VVRDRGDGEVSYRFVGIADLHLGNTLPYARRVDGLATDRLLDGVGVLDQAGQYAAAHRIRDVWSVGDLLDKRLVDAPTGDRSTAAVARLVDHYGLNLHLVPGNHESADAGGLAYCLESWTALRPGKLFVYGTGAQVYPDDGLCFATLPYKPDRVAAERVRELRDRASREPDLAVLLLHQSIKGGRAGNWVCKHGIEAADVEGFAAVFAGHFHTHQAITPTMQFLGAGMQHNFGDAGEKRGFWDITIHDNGKIEQKLVEAAAPQFFSVDWADFDAADDAGADLVPANAYVEVRYKGTRAQLAQMKPDVEAACAGLLKAGARYVKPLPVTIAEKRERAQLAQEGKFTWPSAVAGYLDACDLNGLERARLEEIATTALAEAAK
jgi:DNA repair exonuclease SbcCD nuclease subunit